MRRDKVTLALLGILAGAASGVADTPVVFDVDGVRYMEIEAGDDGGKNVMVCSPNKAGREYQFPFSEEGGQIVSDDGAAIDLFDLSGRRVANHDLVPGIYIAKGAGVAAKVCVRD